MNSIRILTNLYEFYPYIDAVCRGLGRNGSPLMVMQLDRWLRGVNPEEYRTKKITIQNIERELEKEFEGMTPEDVEVAIKLGVISINNND